MRCTDPCTIQCSALIGGHALTLACDLGIGTVALLNIFSYASNPPTSSSSYLDRNEFQQALRTGLLSCAFSVVAFGVNVVGFRNVLRGVNVALRRISHRVSETIRKSIVRTRDVSTRSSTPGAIRKVAPAPLVRCCHTPAWAGIVAAAPIVPLLGGHCNSHVQRGLGEFLSGAQSN